MCSVRIRESTARLALAKKLRQGLVNYQYLPLPTILVGRRSIVKGYPMLSFTKNAIAVLALSGLVFSQPAFAAQSEAGRTSSRTTHSERIAGGAALGWALGAVIAAAALVVIISDNKDHNRSPASP